MIKLAGKNVIVVGLGVTGLSCVRFLLAHGANVRAVDTREALQHELDIPVELGPISPNLLEQADLIMLSPGVSRLEPAIQHAIDCGIEVIGDIELFAQINTKPIIAITGSNGKSTVTMLLAEMFERANFKYVVGGNVGTPVLDLLEDDYDWVILELSSFQLDSTFSLHPFAATVLNVSEDHIDMHGSMQAYRAAKMTIYRGAVHSLANRDDPQTWLAETAPDLTFGLSPCLSNLAFDQQCNCITLNGDELVNLDGSLLTGSHNLLNIQAAAGLAWFAGVPGVAMQEACEQFSGLPHRCQTLSLRNGVRWINDSKATNVGACLAAVEGVASTLSGKLILIAGGDGKGADFTPLQHAFDQYVAVLITLGKDGPTLAKMKPDSTQVDDMSEAVRVASHQARSGDAVLLSPACASLDMFDNYMQRGQAFQQAVEELAA